MRVCRGAVVEPVVLVLVVVGEAVDVVVDVVDVVVVVVAAGQTCWIPRIFSPGGISEEIAAPSGMLNTSPPTTVTRSTQPESASTAAGSIPSPPTATPAEIKPTSCLRLHDTLYDASRPARQRVCSHCMHIHGPMSRFTAASQADASCGPY
ncbi:MAG TPA: hypothetical protein VGX45_03805 [Solirubrobacteraceae bacterium]|nr:hypothetical protein [Solirubrobacteraceae bacterium]